MDNQSFLNFSDSSSSQTQASKSRYFTDKELFKEIFATQYGIQNLSFLKDSYLYFDKYGKQRQIDYAIFLQNKKIAIIFDSNDYSVVEEYRTGDQKIIETSLKSQGWIIYFWLSNGKKDLIRKKTTKELQKLIGTNPYFNEHMGITIQPSKKISLITPLLLLFALTAAAILFPKVSDKLFSKSNILNLHKKESEIKYKKTEVNKPNKKFESSKNNLINKNNENKKKSVDFDSEDF